MKYYKFLEQVFVKVRHISEIMEEISRSGVRGDSEVFDRVNTLREIRQDIIDSEMVSEAITSSLSNRRQLGEWEVANLYGISRAHRILRGIPVDLAAALHKARMDSLNIWVSFSEGMASLEDMIGALSNVVKLSIELASGKSSDLGVENKYDVLLKAYDGDMEVKRIDEIFTDLGAFFRQFLGEVLEKQRGNKVHVAKSVSHDKQKTLHTGVMSAMCASIEIVDSPRWDLLSLMSWPDERIISDELDYRVGLKGTLQSVGKFLYNAHLPKEWSTQLVGGISGSVMYEAQGSLMANHLLMEGSFQEYLLPMLKKYFSFRSRVADINNVRLYLTEVKPDVLMRRSDEVSSLAHIMLRYALEKELMNGALSVGDLPDAWMQGMQYYFDKVPSSEIEGCLQDDYWVRGMFGYLPSKALGAIAASQIFAAIKGCKTDLLAEVGNGNFSNITSWLVKHIYSQGGRYSSTTLLKKITGRRIDLESYKNYLVGKYFNM